MSAPRDCPEIIIVNPNIQPFGGGQLQVANRTWATYVKFFGIPGVIIDEVRLQCTALAVGAAAGEIAIATSPVAYNPAGQTLTKLVAINQGQFTSLTAGAPPFKVVNTTPLGLVIPAPCHVYVLTNFRYGTTQPTLSEGTSHTLMGDFLMADGLGDLTALSTYAMTLSTMALTNHGAPWVELKRRVT